MTNTSQTVSIAMATYNGAKYIQEQLESFAKQTRQPDELIICDDGSTDHTVEICQKFSQTVTFPVYIHVNQNNLGYAQNFGYALSLCSNDIVFLSDQDDVWYADKIKIMVDRFQENPNIQLMIHEIVCCDATLASLGIKKGEWLTQKGKDLYLNYIPGMATAVRKSFLKLCLPIPLNYPHDEWLHKCANIVRQKKFVPDVLAYYRRHASNVTDDDTLVSENKRDKYQSKLDKYQSKIKSNTLKNMTDLSQNNQVRPLLSWMNNNEQLLIQQGLIEEKDFLPNYVHFKNYIKNIEDRIKLLKKIKWRRGFCILKLYFTGGYSQFSGIKSVVKDLLK
ncbi:MAG: glycosyltransferase family 2 protein [Chlamydiota bacterium]